MNGIMNGKENDAAIPSERNAVRQASSDDNCFGPGDISDEAAGGVSADTDADADVDLGDDNGKLEMENSLESNSKETLVKQIATALEQRIDLSEVPCVEDDGNQVSAAATAMDAPLVAAANVSSNTTQSTDENTDAMISVSSALCDAGSVSSSALSPNAEIIPEASDEENQQLANAGIDGNFPVVLVQRLSLSEINHYVTDEQENSSQLENLQAASSTNSINTTNTANTTNTEPTNEESIAEQVPNANEHQLEEDGAGYDDDDEDDDDDDDDFQDIVALRYIERFISSYRTGNFNEYTGRMPNDLEPPVDEQTAYENLSVILRLASRNLLPRDPAMAYNSPALETLRRQGIIHLFRRILFNLNSRITALRLALPQTEGNENNENSAVNEHNEISDNNGSQDNQENQENQIADNSIGQPSGTDSSDEALVVESAELEPEIFDTSLPAEHSYMGTNMDRVSGVGYLEIGQEHNVMLFMHQHVIFPGEILPFMISDIIIDDTSNQQNGFLFGVCFPFLNDAMSSNILLGVTCQIYERGSDQRGNTLIKSRALQRFVTKVSDLASPLEYINEQPQMKCFGNIKILPDIYLPEPLKCLNMGSMNRFRDNTTMSQEYKRFQASTTPFPVNVYDNYSVTMIIEKARTQLAQHKIDTMPSDPVQLSYWLVRNLHIPDNLLYEIFTTNTVNTRLKLIASTFKEESIFTCRYCGIYVANCRELFAMSKHGVQTQYCNSAGYIHETNTVYQVNGQSILYSGSPSTKFSWFPGYKWHIIICKICKHHLGWEFTAVKENLVPKVFFGISSSSVRIRQIQPENSPRLYSILNMNLGPELTTE